MRPCGRSRRHGGMNRSGPDRNACRVRRRDTSPTPAPASRRRASAGRSANQRPSRPGRNAIALPASCARNASRTSPPTSKAAGPIDGPSQATSSPGVAFERRDRRLDDARREPAPARVRDADAAAVAAREEHRQAVGDEHGTDAAGRERHDGIGRVLRMTRQGDDADAVHLLEPGRLRRKLERGAKPSPVLGNGGGLVADVARQIETGIRTLRSRRLRASSSPRARPRAPASSAAGIPARPSALGRCAVALERGEQCAKIRGQRRLDLDGAAVAAGAERRASRHAAPGGGSRAAFR